MRLPTKPSTGWNNKRINKHYLLLTAPIIELQENRDFDNMFENFKKHYLFIQIIMNLDKMRNKRKKRNKISVSEINIFIVIGHTKHYGHIAKRLPKV